MENDGEYKGNIHIKDGKLAISVELGPSDIITDAVDKCFTWFD